MASNVHRILYLKFAFLQESVRMGMHLISWVSLEGGPVSHITPTNRGVK